MDKVLVTTLLTMAAVVASIMVINTVLPALGTSGSSVLSSSGAASDRIKTNIEIITVAGTVGATTTYAWIKNVGAANVLAVSQGDLFWQQGTTAITRIAYDTGDSTPASTCNEALQPANTWRFCVEGGSDTIWKPSGPTSLK